MNNVYTYYTNVMSPCVKMMSFIPATHAHTAHVNNRLNFMLLKRVLHQKYIATAHNDESWSRMLKMNHDRIAKIVYCTPLLAAVVFIVMVLFFTCAAWCSYIQRSGCNSASTIARPTIIISCNARPAIIVASSIVSQVFIAYAFGVSSYACSEIKSQPDFTSNSIPLSHVSILIAVLDGVLLVLSIVTDLLALLMAVHCSDHAFITLSCTIFYASISVFLHSPYIIIAYINDASLTGSMFIFYTITLSSQFWAISRFYTVYVELVHPADSNENVPLLSAKPKCYEIFCKSFIFVLCSLTFCVLIMGVVALLTCYLIILPITNGLSHLFGRLFDTYHTAIAIITAFVAYKTFIEKKNEPDPQIAD